MPSTGRAFSAGDDLDATADLDEAGFRDLIAGFQNLTRAVLDTTVPVVAALNGLAVGGAAELALACDARVGAHSTYFLFPENRIGLTISNGASLLLPRLLGPRAIPLVLDGVRIGAEDAVALGLLTSVVGDPVAEAIALLDRWTAPGTATAFHLRLLRPDRNEIEAAMARETAVAGEVFATGSVVDGAEAFRRR